MQIKEVLSLILDECQKGRMSSMLSSHLCGQTKKALVRRGYLVKELNGSYVVSWGHHTYKKHALMLLDAEKSYMISVSCQEST